MNNRMRIALFVFGHDANRVGGVEIHTHEVVAKLGEQGWRVVLCFHKQPSNEVREYLALPNIMWEALPDAWQDGWRTNKTLLRLLRRHRPELLHFQFTSFLGASAWLARLHGVKTIVFTDHASRPEGFHLTRAPFWKRCAARILTLPMSAVVCVSEYNRQAVSTLGYVAASRIHRIYNGTRIPDDEALSDAGTDFRRRHGIPLGRVLVTQVSWLIPQKGILDVLEAARIAVTIEPLLHFMFVGDGSHREEYERKSAEFGIDAHVTWTGLVRHPIKEGAFAATDISCQASRWEEAFGLVIAEAMAFAKPVVATRVGGIPELVLEGDNGFLVDRGNIAALAERFVLLARNPELRRQMGMAGRRHAQSLFDVAKNVPPLIRLYESAGLVP